MKRRIYFLLITFLSFSNLLFAFSPDSLIVGTGNDWYTLGLGVNLDDGLSFGGQLQATEKNLQLNAAIWAITDKVENLKRYDLGKADISYALHSSYQGFLVSAKPKLGFLAVGNFGLATIQNTFHTWIGRDRLFLDYETPYSLLYATIGSDFTLSRRLGIIETGVKGTYDKVIGWETNRSATFFISLGSVLTIQAGYLSVVNQFTGWETHNKLSESYTGPILAYRFDGGLFQTDWIYHGSGQTSYGTLGLDVMQFFAPKTYKETDFTFSSGFLYDTLGQQNRLFSLSFHGVVFEIKHMNGPMFNAFDQQDKRITIASYMVGYSRECTDTGFVRPYGKFLAGIQRYNLNENYTDTKIEELRPTLGIESGLLIAPEGTWVTGNNSYRLNLVLSLQYVFKTEAIQAIDADFAAHAENWILMAGFALEIDHDL
ncbi:hypothetical protein SpiGrapes_0917 [Sphaerochaeta pleomorpha str. Grapes]|uniref:DUF5723 domain-containing protein n=1 Tax=Sphaerochaeta pleomorpha (strain ATCC BAA-1885 / DSM 22778 / Grapes) TaxID=158190 RepID=G8QQW2_SPHPG|nr:hypothetical protein [Sphaerochaeta pleomorpha]AEV28743.1 hypothetical protein SpiGrapes_0917 [Sphaerochaeta pleomorpha str. Grapes]